MAALSKSELKDLLSRNGMRLSKRLGQNYLVDANIAQSLIRSCRFQPETTVLEIGAGMGSLTEPLADQVEHVRAVEIDHGICPLLRNQLKHRSNVEVLEADILKVLPELDERVSVVGAIPYSITSDILVALCAAKPMIESAWLLMQSEVAQRLEAAVGSSEYGRLSVLIQYHWDVGIAQKVPARAFFPEPHVDSVFVRLLPKPALLKARSEALFFEVVKAAFSYRRKRLVHGLSHKTCGVLDKASAEAVLDSLGWQPGLRAEHLDIEAFVELTNAIEAAKAIQ